MPPVLKGVLKLFSAAALLALMVWLVQPGRLVATLASVDYPLFALALLLAVMSNLVSAARWAHLARAMRLTAPTWPLTGYYFQGMAANAFLPGATVSGDVWRAYCLHRLDNSLLNAGLSVLVERFSGLWVLLLLSLLALPFSSLWFVLAQWLGQWQWMLYLLGLLLWLALPVSVLHPWWRRIPVTRLQHLLERLLQGVHAVSSAAMAGQLLFSLAVQLLSVAALLACAAAVGLDLSWSLIMAAAGPIFFMAALPLGVGGWGTRELAAVAVLGLVAVPGHLAAAMAVLYGINATLQALFGGVLWLRKTLLDGLIK